MTFTRVTPLNRAVRAPYRNREYTQADRDAWARLQAAHDALKVEFLKEWSPAVPAPDDPEAEGYCEASAIESAAFECWQLRRKGRVVAATAPCWVNHVECLWLTTILNDGKGVLEREPTAASVTLPFLMEAGEFSVTYESEKQQEEDGKVQTQILGEKRLRVRSEHGIHFGQLQYEPYEMCVDIVNLPPGTPQDVADRVAGAYSRIIQLDMPNDYPVVMPLRENCAFCGRPFTDQVSKVIGIGPTCASRLGVLYSAERANRIIALRNEMATMVAASKSAS